MKYDSLFNVLYSDKEDVVSYNKILNKFIIKNNSYKIFVK